ncbi:MAG: hypothetical protein F4X44_09935 [Gammaproteobacteria bacterium]|nr:hypothetical protein [Gammaproteobacteria bacterium]
MTMQIGTASSHPNLESSLEDVESCVQDHNKILELLAQVVLSGPELEVSEELKEELAALARRSSATIARIRRSSNR